VLTTEPTDICCIISVLLLSLSFLSRLLLPLSLLSPFGWYPYSSSILQRTG